jgi:hypothetical protein
VKVSCLKAYDSAYQAANGALTPDVGVLLGPQLGLGEASADRSGSLRAPAKAANVEWTHDMAPYNRQVRQREMCSRKALGELHAHPARAGP